MSQTGQDDEMPTYTYAEKLPVMLCLKCDEPVMVDQHGVYIHLFTGQPSCTYRSHL